MNVIRLGNTDIFVTPVGLGVLTVGSTQLDLSFDDGAGIVRHALENGITFLDTAEYYRTYPYIKRALNDLAPSFSQSALSRPVIMSKSLSSGYIGMERAIDECRKALNLDQIDIFLLHEIREAPDFENRGGAWECLLDSKAKGYVKSIGLSTHHSDVVQMAAEVPCMDIIFALINFKGLGIRKGSESGTKEGMENAIETAADKGIGVIAMKALGGGNLASDYRLALDYVSGLKGITSVMLGMGCKKEVDIAVAWAEGRLPEEFIPDIADKKMFVDRGDCECCGACVSRCTSGAILIDETGIASVDTEKCVLCGYCAPVCPVRALIYL